MVSAGGLEFGWWGVTFKYGHTVCVDEKPNGGGCVCVCDGGEMLVYKGVENQTKSHEEIEVAKSSGWTAVTNNNRKTWIHHV